MLVVLLLLPTLAEANVDILFCGHTHDYERGFIPDGDGMYYIITGGGGGPLDTVFNHDWDQIDVHASEYHYMTVDIVENETIVTAWLTSGEMLDQFEIQKY